MAWDKLPVEHSDKVTTTGPTSLIGKVKVVIFERGLFRILAVKVEEANFEWDQSEITIKGQLGEVVEGDRYEFEGRVVEDKRYGLQFASSGVHVVLPQNPPQLATFVKYHGVTLHAPKKSSQAVFKGLGEQAMKQVTDDPQILKTITGFGIGDQQRLIDFFTSHDFGNTTGKIIEQLKGYGLSERLVNVVFDRFGTQTLTQLTTDPYALLKLEDGELGFERVDELARRYYQVSATDSRRLQAALLTSARQLTNQSGDSWVDQERLLSAALRLVSRSGQVSRAQVSAAFASLLTEEKLVADGEHIYPAALDTAEWQIAACLHELIEKSTLKAPAPKRLQAKLSAVEADQPYEYDQIQKEAIELALTKPVMLLTGGPGTGKTTIVKGIVQTFLKLHPKAQPSEVLLVAPTGRAAKQISAVTGIESSTIHRLLGLTAEVTDETLVNEVHDELPGQLLIVDEMSMTSLTLFAALLRAVGPKTRVVLVGDFDQLPSVGPGQVFRDLLAVPSLPQIRLTQIHRQAADSSIIPLARAINVGEVTAELFAPADPAKYQRRRFFRAPITAVPAMITEAVKLYHERHGLSLMEIQILAPIHAGPAGTQYLNTYLQAQLNPEATDKPQVTFGNGWVFRVGDKVMQTVNDPDKNVFNGDLGMIQSIEGTTAEHTNRQSKAALKLIVDFDGTEVEYTRPQDVGALQLAYCMTIHKAQGSQAAVVILPLVPEYFPASPNAPTIMQRNLLYTAVTRAARALMLIGDPQAFVYCANTPPNYRHTTLTERVAAAFAGEAQPPTAPKRPRAAESDAPSTAASPAEVADPNLSTGADALPFDHQAPQVASLASVDPVELTPALVEAQTIDPMIGMGDLSPADC